MGIAMRLPFPLSRLIYMRDLVRELLVREMKLRYERSLLGVVWAVLNPLTQILVSPFCFVWCFDLQYPGTRCLSLPGYWRGTGSVRH